MTITSDTLLIALLGCGAIGSRLAAHLPAGACVLCVDQQVVAPENLGIASFTDADLFQPKAQVVAAQRRAAGGRARALVGDVRYLVRPGLARHLAAACLCLDNRAAIRDACAALWSGRPDLPVFVLTCGSGREYQVRACVTPHTCPVCTWTPDERDDVAPAYVATCADTTAPRASAAAADAAARVGARLVAAALAGESDVCGLRLQCDGGEEYAIRMPGMPSAACPIPHGDPGPIERLGGAIDRITVGGLAARALTQAGGDAEILLGRRAVPLGGLFCAACRTFAAAPQRLRPAAFRQKICACARPKLRPLDERTRLGARELLTAPEASLTLAAWGAGAGDVFEAVGAKGRVRLGCDLGDHDLAEEAADVPA
jgi:hypothetical protein